MTITFPDEIGAVLTRKAAAAGYDDAGEYIASVLLTDEDSASESEMDFSKHLPEHMKYSNREELELRLMEGHNSGEPILATPELYAKIRERVKSRIARP